MKKILTLVAVFVLTIALAACGKETVKIRLLKSALHQHHMLKF